MGQLLALDLSLLLPPQLLQDFILLLDLNFVVVVSLGLQTSFP